MKENKRIKSPGIGNGRKIGIIFILIALLPALFYTAYEVSSLSSTETLIQSIYSKQLDVILFSINQYALDVAQNWSGGDQYASHKHSTFTCGFCHENISQQEICRTRRVVHRYCMSFHFHGNAKK